MNRTDDCRHGSAPAECAQDGAQQTPCPLAMSARSRARYLLQVKLILPMLTLMRQGATPERLAWSLAVGFAIGVNPLLGSTTVACLAFAYILRLNIVASQLANHLAYPLELLLLLLPFIRIGRHLFGTQRMPWSPGMLLHLARVEPIRTTELLWMWEWHALVVWAAFSVLLVPALAVVLTPLLRHAQRRLATRSAGTPS
ncbi:MAG: DUF2062 domain-containing protein [Acidobacteriaceae bacterium]